ncbi:MAG: hypothetical protein LBC09_00370 [Helicobacteraceae bacterium]|jgi:hypothetical protein|nr:hypothetical protein [Helicobacteraceae bacterium]
MGDFTPNNQTIRDEIARAVKALKIDESAFGEVKSQWDDIVDKTVKRFVAAKDYKEANMRWAWTRFNQPYASAVFADDRAYKRLPEIIEDDRAWFFAEESFDKFWIYEVKPSLIPLVLDETPYFEYYVVSKKYDWLLCENHHGRLFAVGERVIAKLNGIH